MAENPQPQNTPLIQNGERRRTYLRLITEIAIAIVGVVALGLLGRPVLGILMPFILAFIMAWMFNPIIAWLQRRLRLTRKLFSYILVLVFTRCCSASACFRRSARFSGDRPGTQRADVYRPIAGSV